MSPEALVADHMHIVDAVVGATRRLQWLLDADERRSIASEALWEAAKRFPGGSFGGWAYTRCRWRVLDAARKAGNKPVPFSSDEPLPDGRVFAEVAGGVDPWHAVDDRLEVSRLLQALPDNVRQVVVAVDLEGWTLEDVAGALGVGKTTAYRLRHRGLSMMAASV